MKTKPPVVDNRAICIVNKNDIILASVVSSYFAEKDTYYPIFIFPEVSCPKSDILSGDDNYFSDVVAGRASTLINNALARMGGAEHYIFVGMNSNQKSYLDNFPESKVIEIDSLESIETSLEKLNLPKRDKISCRTKDVLRGLFLAKKSNKILSIDETVADLSETIEPAEGIVVVENKNDTRSVVAVNYAFSINASLSVVEEINKEETQSIQNFINKWKENRANNQLEKIKNKVLKRIGSIDFSKFKFATFFTEGLPYSLVLENIIPITYAPLSLRPDLFVVNNLIFEFVRRFNSAIIFSPEFFPDEETMSVINFFNKNFFFVRPLLKDKATVHNLDFYAQHFPYDILHICSHGGEAKGQTMQEDFTDRDGNKHTVEYDEVVGFAPVPGQDLIGVTRKVIFRKFDNYQWMSDELKAQKFSDHVYKDMWKAMSLNDERTKPRNVRVLKRKVIPTSCSIVCHDSIHQGTFQILASHSSPMVFNNTCISWDEVSTFFLEAGCRMYIGTLWSIGNTSAVIGANTFYENLFKGTALSAFFKSIKALSNTADKDIYVFWGLHFSTLSPAKDSGESRHNVFREMIRSLFAWRNKIETTGNLEVRNNSIGVLKLIHRTILKEFSLDDFLKLDKEVEAKMKEISSMGSQEEEKYENDGPIITRSSVDRPISYKRNTHG